MKFSHVGITTNTKRPGEVYVAETKVWVTNADDHRFRIEWLRYEEDSPVSDIIKEMPHIGYEVESIDEVCSGLKCILGPFKVHDGKTVAFFELPDGAIIELIEINR
ncbi:hypothetical protein [Bacillus sp. FJAT-50079]|uniref:VOC family protein n=1 Tax=Bacillus sp. FJAT-50079 TaxID=2833577 RepID=UPI001BCA2B46|nr:hypothetical protein [Bacillus sp. FJAT-50079]MBS4207885.1 hypothetical protein [Bacillus sp. FJAT-50079]